MKIAIVQMSPVTGDLYGNFARIKSEIVKAGKEGADLIVFPEMALSGYCISDLVEDEFFVKKNKELIEKLAKETAGQEAAAIIGFVDYDMIGKNSDGRMKKYNAAALIQAGEIVGITHKSLLPNYRYFDDKRYFSPGEERKVFQISTYGGKKINVGISICEDMWDKDYDVKPIKELAGKGADILVNINASPFYPGKFAKREAVIKNHIKNTHLPFVYANTVGSADNGKNIIPFDGQSLVYDRNGNLIALGKKFEEEVMFVDTEKDSAVKVQKSSREKELFEALVMSLRDYAVQTGFKKAILPLSGGIDSALGLAITAEALGSENVTAYNLPSVFNSEMTKGIAEKLAKNLGIEYKVIPISDIDSKVRGVFENNDHEIKHKISKENLHARIRGILMMLESNDSGALLVSNGNKTEIALGYSTLYGDMCGGISVIGDLSKTDVYDVSRYVNDRFKKEIIPNEVFTIKPSAELSEEQADPFDYSVVSPVVESLVEKRDSPNGIINKFREKKLGERFPEDIYEKYDADKFGKLVRGSYRLMKRSVYKRLQGPPIIAVTERAFGFDLRETLINKWEGRV